jgi:hypothetical protein
MPDSYFNIKTSDRAELEAIVEDIKFKEFKSDVADSVAIAVDKLNISEDVEEQIVKDIIENIEIKYLIEDFINAIGLMGWQIFSRKDCIEIEKRLMFFQAFKQSKLPEAMLKYIQKKPRVPRVKKLLVEK